MVSCYCAGGGDDEDDDSETININADDLEEDEGEKLKRGPTTSFEKLFGPGKEDGAFNSQKLVR